MQFSLIVAMSKGRVIGCNNGIPWKLSADMKHFRETTMGKVVVMGRRTFESIGKPLPGRHNVVITRNSEYGRRLVEAHNPVYDHSLSVAQNPESARWLIGHLFPKQKEVMVIGGEQIYREFLPFANKIYLTQVLGDYLGDSFFPELGSEWELMSDHCHPQDKKNSDTCIFQVWERRRRRVE